jgi:Uma2 family endonuclease
LIECIEEVTWEMVTQTKRLAYEDYLHLPETNQRYEIIEGELIMTPSPNVRHQRLVRHIANLLDQITSEKNRGVVLVAPMDVVIKKTPILRTRQPDILFISYERIAAAGYDQNKFDLLSHLEMAPELVVEVLSPHESRPRISSKLRDYHKIGVKECWLVSSETETIEVVDLSGPQIVTQAVFGIESSLASKVLEDLSLGVRQIFG